MAHIRGILDQTAVMFRFLRYIPFIFLLVGLTCSAQEGDGEDSDTQTVIQIRVISQLRMRSLSWTPVYYSSRTEFDHFSKALGESLKNIEGDYQFEFRHFPKKIDEEKFHVSIYLHEWRSSFNGLIEVYFSARYGDGDEKQTLGSFRGESNVIPSPISSLQDRACESAVLDAGERFVEKLQPVLDQYFSEEGEGEGQ